MDCRFLGLDGGLARPGLSKAETERTMSKLPSSNLEGKYLGSGTDFQDGETDMGETPLPCFS